MSPTKRCPHCDTALEFESGGQRLAFTAHDEKFYTLVTRDRVQFLKQAMQAEREAYERSNAALRRQTNEMLKNKPPSMPPDATDADGCGRDS